LSTTKLLLFLFFLYIGIRPILRSFTYLGVYIPVAYIISSGLIIYSVLELLKFSTSNKRINLKTSVICLVLLFLIVVIINLFGYNDILDFDDFTIDYYLMVISNTILFSSLMLLTGLKFQNIYVILRDNLFARYIIMLYILLLVSITTNYAFLSQRDMIGYSNLVGDSFAIFSLVIIYMGKSTLRKALIIFISLLVLLIIGSRTSYTFYMLAIVPLVIREGVFNKNLKRAIIILSVALFFLIIILFGDQLSDHRMFVLFFGLQQDSSFASRIIQFEHGIYDLSNNWLKGNYLLAYDVGHIGKYMHNWLSFFLYYGLVPFSIFAYLFLYSIRKIYFLVKQYPYLDCVYLILSISIFTFLNIIFSRSFIYPYIWFSLGAILNFNREGSLCE
jgi:hypothetical protein